MKILKFTSIVFIVLCVPASPMFSEQSAHNTVHNHRTVAAYTGAGLGVSFPFHNTVSFRSPPPVWKSRTRNARNGDYGSVYQEIQKRGGFRSGLKSLFFGPRVGLEANENKSVTFIEKANLLVPLAPFQAYSVNGIKGFAASAFFGPRVGMEIKERKIRRKEWLGLIPVIGVAYHLSASKPSTSTVLVEVAVAALLSRIWSAFEAFRGRTMTEIESAENLKR